MFSLRCRWTLISSGFIAGGALVGVLSALLRFAEDSWHVTIIPDLPKVVGPWLETWGNWTGLVVFLLLGLGVFLDARREKA